MKLFKVTQDVDNGYDTFDSAVVCADNEEEAKSMHPQVGGMVKIKDIKVEYIGEAREGLEKGCVVESFNAG